MKSTHATKRPPRARKPRPVALTRIACAPDGEVIDMIPRVLNLQRILVPVDFSKPADKALRYAVSFARQFDAKITLLHVSPQTCYPAELAGFPTVIPPNEPGAKAIRARLEAHAARFVPPELRDRTLLRVGPAFDEICRVARAGKTDLIIIATHGHTGLKHALLGSTAERVVRHAPCPVLVVRETEREFA